MAVRAGSKNYEPIFLMVVNEDNEVLGMLLSVIQKEYGGILGNLTARSITWGGPLVKDDDLEIFKLILIEYNKIAREKAIYSQFRNLSDMQEFRDVFDNWGYHYEDNLNILINLAKSEDSLWEKFIRKDEMRLEELRKRVLMFRN